MILARRDRPRKTVEDFMSLPEGTRAELIDGDIFMSPAPRPRHQRVAFRLAKLVDAHVSHHDLGEVFMSPLDVLLPFGDIVQPDLLFIAKKNLGIVGEERLRGVPDLIVEVLSPDRRERDRIVKHGLYADNGVREYWIVDPDERSFEVFSLRGERYEPSGYFDRNVTLVSPLLPNLKLPVADVFAEPH